MMERKQEKSIETEISLKELMKIFNINKWLIIGSMFLFLLLSTIYLFFKPSIYTTHAIIEVNTFDQNSRVTDDLLQNAFYSTNKEIEKEMEILQTFEINKIVIEEMDLETQVFKKEHYKKYELFNDELPIKIKNINIIDKKILGKTIKLIPTSSQRFKLEMENSNFLIQKSIILDNNTTHKYNTKIKNQYFEFSIEKKMEINEPIYLVLNGDSRSIYENIISKNLIIQQINKNASLIRISYEDTIPERATIYVNKLVDVFLAEGLKSKSTRNHKILTFINKQLKSIKTKLNSSEKNLQNYKVDNNIINTSIQVDSIIKELGGIEVEISKNTLKNQLIDTVLEQFKVSGHIDAMGPFLIGLGDRVTTNLITSLQSLLLKEKKLSAEYTDAYPELLTLREQIEQIQNKILLNIKNLKTSIKKEEKNFKKLQAKYENALLDFPVKEMNLVNLTRTYEVNSKMYDYLLKKKSENEIIKVAIISDFKVVEHAYPATRPIKPKRSLVMVFSLILGLIVGMLISLIRHNSGNKITIIKDIEEHTSLPINSVIPYIKNSKTRDIEVFKQRQPDLLTSFRKLRTDLCFSYNLTSNQVIVVTSMRPKEGKSFITANLSAIFQLAGYKSIVIDLALNDSILDQYFNINHNNKGISNYLNEEVNVHDIIMPTSHTDLDFIPIGSLAHKLSELILSDKFESLLSTLKDRYDYVFIDSADIDALPDIVGTMKYADINLVVMRSEQTKKSSIDKIEKMISKYKLKNIGLVLNGVSRNKQQKDYI